jgi:hypothetical protein
MTAPSPWTCAGCGAPGRISTIAVDPKDTRPVLRVSFGSAGEKPALLCSLCRTAKGRGTSTPPTIEG